MLPFLPTPTMQQNLKFPKGGFLPPFSILPNNPHFSFFSGFTIISHVMQRWIFGQNIFEKGEIRLCASRLHLWLYYPLLPF